MDFYTYILENEHGRLYIGQTNDLEKRLRRHNTNRVSSTKNKGPWKLIFSKKHRTRTGSVRHEQYLKSLKNPDYIRKELIGE